ncbi:hypothetical protein E4U42_007605 [Claviceps africana]|uniref:Uncharacterized protein n=1 Tax=Claviceps africana TaxID=83212 RepID=A0A8K0J3N9_9HYPO|nr:hypothetical protein E4U42_007605 [Claviceps africana]
MEYTMFNRFGSWEVEKIACFNAFAEEKYDQVFATIAWDVDEMNPKFSSQHPPTPDGMFELGDHWLREVIISRGLQLLLATSSILDHVILVSTMQDNIISWGDFIQKALTEGALDDLRNHRPLSIKEELQSRRAPLPFVVEDVASAAGTSLPPLAWTLLWRVTYGNL